MGTGTKIVTHTGMGMGTGIFLKCGYGDGHYSTLPIAIPNKNEQWNWQIMEGWIPNNIPNKIATLPTPTDANGKDERAGIGGTNMEYYVAAMYDQLCSYDIQMQTLCGTQFGSYASRSEFGALFGYYYTTGYSLTIAKIGWGLVMQCVVIVLM
jgi:hypothetical protein